MDEPKLIAPDALILRRHVGTARLGDVEYELTTSASGAPLVKNMSTGVTCSLGWEWLIDQARAAGVDQEWSKKLRVEA